MIPSDSSLSEMAANTTPGLQIQATKQCIPASQNVSKMSTMSFNFGSKRKSFTDFRSSSHISLAKPIHSFKLAPIKFERMVTKAMSGASEQVPVSGLPIDLRGCSEVSMDSPLS